MTIYTLSHGSLKLGVSDQGGVIEGFWRDTTPLLRPGKKKRCGNRCLLFSAGAIWYRLASLFSVVAANADSGTGERLLAGAGAVAGG